MKVRATVKCFIDNAIREEGEVFEYNGQSIPILEPLEDEVPKPAKRGRRSADDGNNVME